MNKPTKENWWLNGVEYPWRRGELILYLLPLSDRAYQDWVWATGRMQRPDQKGKNRFDTQLSFAWDFFLEDLGVLDAKTRQTNRLLGFIYKSEQERDAVEEMAQRLEEYVRAIDAQLHESWTGLISAPPEVCMSAPGRDELIAAAKKAFDVFMETEKDNEKFVEFIDEMKARMKKGDLI